MHSPDRASEVNRQGVGTEGTRAAQTTAPRKPPHPPEGHLSSTRIQGVSTRSKSRCLLPRPYTHRRRAQALGNGIGDKQAHSSRPCGYSWQRWGGREGWLQAQSPRTGGTGRKAAGHRPQGTRGRIAPGEWAALLKAPGTGAEEGAAPVSRVRGGGTGGSRMKGGGERRAARLDCARAQRTSTALNPPGRWPPSCSPQGAEERMSRAPHRRGRCHQWAPHHPSHPPGHQSLQPLHLRRSRSHPHPRQHLPLPRRQHPPLLHPPRHPPRHLGGWWGQRGRAVAWEQALRGCCRLTLGQ